MSISTTWRVEIGSIASPDNFTSRTLGMSITQSVDVAYIGRGTCVVTLLNKDGALTPGGGGAYSSTDWFAQGVFITAITGAPTTVFHGVVTDFALADDGVFSTVTITAQDGLSVAARTLGSTIQGDGLYNAYYAALVDRNGIVFPRLGQSNAEGNVTSEYQFTQPTVGLAALQPAILPTTYADALQQYLIPSVNDVTWATDTYISGGVTKYQIISLGNTTTRSIANQKTFEFVPTASISTTQLPFDDQQFVQGFNNDTLINQAQTKASFTGAVAQIATASTNTSYGNRTVQYTSTLNLSDTETAAIGSRLVNRYSTSRFSPVQLSLTASMVKKYCPDTAESQWRYLLSIDLGIWQRAKITWQGSGAATQTAYCVIKGRRIDVTPQDTRITLMLGNWADNHGFILDTDQLDADRLG